MAERCRVSFFDLEHQMRRFVEVETGSPMEAAETALKKMLAMDMFVADFGDTVQVEVITTAALALPLEAIAQRIGAVDAPMVRMKVA